MTVSDLILLLIHPPQVVFSVVADRGRCAGGRMCRARVPRTQPARAGRRPEERQTSRLLLYAMVGSILLLFFFRSSNTL